MNLFLVRFSTYLTVGDRKFKSAAFVAVATDGWHWSVERFCDSGPGQFWRQLWPVDIAGDFYVVARSWPCDTALILSQFGNDEPAIIYPACCTLVAFYPGQNALSAGIQIKRNV